MTYNENKPDPGPSPFLDAPTIQNNFAQFSAVFSSTAAGVNYNHTALNNPNQGDHESVILTLQANDPGVSQNLAVLYCKNALSMAGTQPQLFVQVPKFLPTENDTNNAPNTGMQLTYNSVNTSGPVYQSFLPGGYLLYFGHVASTGTVTLSPAPTKILAAIATPNNLTSIGTPTPFTIGTTILNNFQFNINSSSTGAFTIGWFAIAQA